MIRAPQAILIWVAATLLLFAGVSRLWSAFVIFNVTFLDFYFDVTVIRDENGELGSLTWCLATGLLESVLGVGMFY